MYKAKILIVEDEYIEAIKYTHSKSYLRSVEYTFKDLLKFSDNLQLSKFDNRYMDNYIISTFKRSKYTAALYFRTLKAAFSKAADWDYISTNPFNKIKLPNGAYAVIDNSHTSDSLKNAIEAATEIRGKQKEKGRVITIFGCGGNKDKTKRPVMGDYATSLSDYSIITSDNPRYENPMSIINEVLAGIKNKTNYEVEENREEAIKKGISMSKKSDIILICGKGHETYQEIKGLKSHFDDKEIVEKYINLAKL